MSYLVVGQGSTCFIPTVTGALALAHLITLPPAGRAAIPS